MPSVVVFAPHNDDHALAMGGTIAKHYKDGDDVHTFVGSYGEMSHPHLRPEVIRKTRVKEAQRADRCYGGDGHVQFLGLRELNFKEDYERKGYPKKLRKRLKELKATKVYITAPNDTHPDHKALAALVLQTLEGTGVDIYSYYVYPNLRSIQAPRHVVDVSRYYRKKIEGIHQFKSQIHFFTYAVTNNIAYVYQLARNWCTGFLNGTRFMETFYKLR